LHKLIFDSILDKFFVDVQPKNNRLRWDNITILNPHDPECGDNDDNEKYQIDAISKVRQIDR
jgi:hypothetical protein